MESIFCSICTNKYIGSEEVVATACGHVYHKICIGKWINSVTNSVKTCPDCRTPVQRIRRLYFNIEENSFIDNTSKELRTKQQTIDELTSKMSSKTKELEDLHQRFTDSQKKLQKLESVQNTVLELESEVLRLKLCNTVVSDEKERMKRHFDTKLKQMTGEWDSERNGLQEKIADLEKEVQGIESLRASSVNKELLLKQLQDEVMMLKEQVNDSKTTTTANPADEEENSAKPSSKLPTIVTRKTRNRTYTLALQN